MVSYGYVIWIVSFHVLSFSLFCHEFTWFLISYVMYLGTLKGILMHM